MKKRNRIRHKFKVHHNQCPLKVKYYAAHETVYAAQKLIKVSILFENEFNSGLEAGTFVAPISSEKIDLLTQDML